MGGTVIFTPNPTNAPRYSYSLTQVGNLVAGVINVAPNSGSSYSANTWYEVGTISKVPSINGSTSGFEEMSRFCATIAGTGEYGGIVDVKSDGKVKVYPIVGASSLSINLAYMTS